MKIKGKLFFLLLTVVVVFVASVCYGTLRILYSRTETEKTDLYDQSIRQILLSYEYITDEIERYVYESSRTEELVSCYTSASGMTSLELQMNMKLEYITSCSPFISAAAFVTPDGGICLCSNPIDRPALDDFIASTAFSSEKDNVWFYNDNGMIYLRRRLYQVYPYRCVGMLAVQVDRQYLQSMIGFNILPEGNICIINSYGDISMLREDNEASRELFSECLEEIRSQQTAERKRSFRNTEYRTIAVSGIASGISDQWHILFAVTEREMQSFFYQTQNIVVMVGCVLILIAAVISSVIAHAFTTNLRKLKSEVQNIRNDEQNTRIQLKTRDEVGELASEFNDMLDRLEDAHEAILKETRDTQKAKYEMIRFKYRSLQAQISPHFLCNILSSISLLSAAGESDQVEKLAFEAGRYLRNNLKTNDRKYNTIEEETKLADEFIQLVNAISANPVTLQTEYRGTVGQVIIPNMILQPLVENSIKHGVNPKQDLPFVIRILAEPVDGNRVALSVMDNGNGYTDAMIDELHRLAQDNTYQSEVIGFGTSGVIRRLSLQYGQNFEFTVCNNPEGGACTRIVIPPIDPTPDR